MSEVIKMKEIKGIQEFEDSRFYNWVRGECEYWQKPETTEEVMDVFRQIENQGSGDEPGFLIRDYFEGDENLLKSYLEENLVEHQTLSVSQACSGTREESVSILTKDLESLGEEELISEESPGEGVPESFRKIGVPEHLIGCPEFDENPPPDSLTLEYDFDYHEWSVSNPYLNLPKNRLI